MSQKMTGRVNNEKEPRGDMGVTHPPQIIGRINDEPRRDTGHGAAQPQIVGRIHDELNRGADRGLAHPRQIIGTVYNELP
jgi:hypothetical protein